MTEPIWKRTVYPKGRYLFTMYKLDVYTFDDVFVHQTLNKQYVLLRHGDKYYDYIVEDIERFDSAVTKLRTWEEWRAIQTAARLML